VQLDSVSRHVTDGAAAAFIGLGGVYEMRWPEIARGGQDVLLIRTRSRSHTSRQRMLMQHVAAPYSLGRHSAAPCSLRCRY
jgi:hypothetical protein